jgi:Lon-like protease
VSGESPSPGWAIEGPTEPDAVGPAGPPRRRWVPILILVVVLALIVVGSVLIHRGTEDYYAYSPGTAPQIVSDPSCRNDAAADELVLPDGTPCANLTVPADKRHAVQGRLYMVDVLVGPATWSEYVLDRLGLLSHFDAGTQLVPASEVLGGTPANQLQCQDTQEMNGATEAASVAALRHLGYSVEENDLGAQVDTVAPGTAAAASGMQCNDVITSFDGRAVRTSDQLVSAIHQTRPGQAVAITVQRAGDGGKTVTRTLHASLTGTPAEDGASADPKRAFLGIVTESRITYTLPFQIQIDVGDIGGPSAGLALTLGLLDVLSNGNLTGGHRIAATGTIDAEGNVGDVGGVAQKTVAVKRAGAQLFLVPPEELKVAEGEAGSGLKVEAVSTLGQALADLKAFGGDVGPLATVRSSG